VPMTLNNVVTEVVLKCTFILIVAFGLVWLCRRTIAIVRYRIWNIALISLLVLMGFALVRPALEAQTVVQPAFNPKTMFFIYHTTASGASVNTNASVSPVQAAALQASSTSTVQSTSAIVHIPWSLILLIVWALGGTLTFGYWIWQWRLVIRLT